MAEDAVFGARLGVIADEQRAVEVRAEALELAQLALHAGFEFRLPVHVFGTDVAHVAVRVRHHDVRRAALYGALDRGVDVAGHDLPKRPIAGQTLEHLLDRFHPGNAFHVYRNEDAHTASFAGVVRPVVPGRGATSGFGSFNPLFRRPARQSSSQAAAASRMVVNQIPGLA